MPQLKSATLCQTERDTRIQNLHWLRFPASEGSMPDRLSMRATLAMTAWMVSLVSSYENTAISLPGIENEDFIKDCVRFHNKFRSEVNPTASDMLYMTWDPALARVAQTWARNCQFVHNVQLHSSYKLHPNFSSLGENIWAGSLSLFSASSAITNWYDEVQYYDFRTQKCTKVCGHYTQTLCGRLVTKWAVQYSIVPAFMALVFPTERFSYATTDQEQYRSWPYREGSTCSACPNDDKCLDNLCINPQRDKVTRYYSVVYPDWPVSFF
ncbi:glioma pathogenesis-related protein 1 [Prionailurus iriomotensis]